MNIPILTILQNVIGTVELVDASLRIVRCRFSIVVVLFDLPLSVSVPICVYLPWRSLYVFCSICYVPCAYL